MTRQNGSTFGLTSNSGRGRGTFKRRGGSNTHSGAPRPKTQEQKAAIASLLTGTSNEATSIEDRFEEARQRDEIDAKLGFERLEQGESREAWLVNMHPTLVPDNPLEGPGHATGKSAVDFYFIQDDASMFKITVQFAPYILLGCRPNTEAHVEEWLRRKYEGLITKVSRVVKDDLKMANHLVGLTRTFVKIEFHNIQDLLAVRRELLPLALKAQKTASAVETYADVLEDDVGGSAAMAIEMEEELYGGASGSRYNQSRNHAKSKAAQLNPEDCINDIREYDVPYYLRVAIDNDIRVGLWYTVSFDGGAVSMVGVPSRVKRAEPTVLAFDIETTKLPLKFPDAASDSIMMISYMIDGQGYLITNREIVSEDIGDFEYSPKEEYEGPFIIFNESNEMALIQRFFSHFREAKPTVVVTYNGDSFDFPFVETRANHHGISMLNEIGFAKDNEGEYKSRSTAHMDCFRWVKRDSYLPQGSQGLKAVTVAKLGYDPMELDPELMTPYAVEQPQILAQYSVSDAVATYYLYMKYVHPFIFSLCNIIPLNPDEVLRKGSGTLCETLLMVQAYQGSIIMPNRHTDPVGSTYQGHLLESETYVGGHVEALEAGVFRSDIETDFKVDPTAFDELIGDLDSALRFSIEVESKVNVDDVTNFDEVKQEIKTMLEHLRDNPILHVEPLIYHLDVAAMYPNIMLSNRLQPDSVKDEAACAACDFNRPGMKCDKKMEWSWRGEYFPAKKDEVNMIRHALSKESFPPRFPDGPRRTYHDLGINEQDALLKKRLGDYSRKVYRKTHETRTVKRETVICQRENPFYIDTVRDFRDRRYEYKGLHKTWKKNLDKAQGGGSLAEVMEAKKMIVLYDSLQMAHKCILNSFYGYVMRKGARWYSMEMAGITCLTGATIIQLAKDLVDRIGRPLELDTDGIWCMLPGNFPENFTFKTKSGKGLGVSYPCTMLNYLVHQRFTNHQYHALMDDNSGRYEIRSENSIFFELDGPYRAMILPSSKEEDKLLKKRYAVFNHDGSLAELKGFEVKRRGELQLIKDFQKQIFEKFLLGKTLVECYDAVAQVADQWLDVLFSRGSTLHDEELVDLIAENKSMSRTLQEYGSQKSTAITTAKRLAEFLGAEMVKDKGLACKFIISEKPHGAPVTERAVPVAIFNAEPSVKQYYLRRFLRDNSLNNFDLRSILDWNYYIDRFGSVIQKLITIPAAMQRVKNPVPRIRHPDWLFKRVAAGEDKLKQRKLTEMFKATSEKPAFSRPPPELIIKKAANGRIAQVEVVEDIPIPDMNVDYPGWIKGMKSKWRKMRKERKANNGQGRLSGRKDGSMVSSMLYKRSQNMAVAVWDLVQVCPTTRQGEYRLWISVDNRLQSFKVRIPRVFYIHFKSVPRPGTFNDAYLVENVVRTLPRGKACRHLYKLTVSEELFLDEEPHFSSLINHPNVDAVYEMQVPLYMRALIQLGSTCSLKTSSRAKFSRALDYGFDLTDLVKTSHPSIERHTYLNDGKDFRWIYMWHGTKDGKHVIGLFSQNALQVHIIDPSGIRQLPALEPMYKERVNRWRENGRLEGGVFEYRDEMEMEVKIHTSANRAWKTIAKELTIIRKSSQTPSMFAICSSRNADYYESKMGSSIMAETPYLSIPAAHQDDELPVLGWQMYSVKRMLNCYLRTSHWILHWLRVSAHFDVPLCSIRGADVSLFAADIDFARRLTRNDMLLWWSETGNDPDLGNIQIVDSSNAISSNEASNSRSASAPLEISKPGAYNNVVFEMTLGHLALNAVLQSGNINDMEGTEASGSMAFDTTSHNLDEYSKGSVNTGASMGDAAVTSQVFWTLKSMVKAWYIDKVRNKNPYSHALADGFWRWLSSEVGKSRSCLYEPALASFVRALMRKTLLQLLAECKRMGASIVFANFSKLFILTSKPTAGSAAAFGRYMVSAITSRDLFKHIDLEIVHHWDYLVWMDSANFGGVICRDPEQEQEQGVEDLQKPFHVDMNWNIASFLPQIAQEKFNLIIGGFIRRLYDGKRKAFASHSVDRTPLTAIKINARLAEDDSNPYKRKALTGQDKEGDVEEEEESSAAATLAKELLTKWVTRKMLIQTQELRDQHIKLVHSLPEDFETEEESFEGLFAEWKWPELPGGSLLKRASNVSLTDDAIPPSPALEFVKATMAVLSLQKEAQVEVGICKRNVLSLLNIGEFSPEADFIQPCEILKPTPTIICTSCNEERTLDLCRDSDLLKATQDGQQWRCIRCQNAYDRSDIEIRLCKIAQEAIRSFVLQDLRCSRCHTLREGNVGAHCPCSGPWALTLSRRDVRLKLTLLQRISQFHHLPILEEAVEELITSC